jgi:hypothetical protein
VTDGRDMEGSGCGLILCTEFVAECKHGKPLEITGSRTEVRNGDIPNSKQKCSPFDFDVYWFLI